MRYRLKNAASLAALAAPALLLPGCGKPQPNILFILADDYGWKDTGATGSTFYETPSIDRIAADGVNFTQSYAACQVSSPSRASLMTGLFTTRHGITDWIGEKSGEDWRTMGRHTPLLPADYEHELDCERFATLPELLKEGGYSTFMAGKWHLGRETTPEDAGFEINKGGYWAGHPQSGYFVPYNNPKLPDGPKGENLSMRLASETCSFLREQKTSKKPFFIYLSFYAVHSPIQTTREKWQHFRDKSVEMVPEEDGAFLVDRTLPVRQRQDDPVYAGLVNQMDDAIGMVMDELRSLGLDKNTIVVFTSDNGGVSSGDNYSTSNLPLRGGKGRQWEGGLRVPLFVSVPGNKLKGSSNDTPVCTIDMLPTLLDYAGVPVPEGIDGVSIRPLMEGKHLADRPLYWHYPHYGNQGGDPSTAMREGKWKLIWYHLDGHYELYDLENDEKELHDVADDNPEVLESMAARMQSWLKETGALLPVPDPEYAPGDYENWLDVAREQALQEQNRLRTLRRTATWQPGPDWWGSEVND
ncbi:MAG: sulfatase [Bacteroidales bacterium]|nr:sulfatase [Bacteroidales bacterium]